MKEAEAKKAFHYLLDAKTEGRIVSLRFYNAQANKMLEIADSDDKPYFFLPHPMSKTDEKEIRNLNGETEVVTKYEFFTNQPKEYTKVTVYTPDLVRKADKILETAWETEIKYPQSYVYDNNLIFGAAYTIAENTPVLVARAQPSL